MKIKTTDELISDNMIVKHYAGSIAYGTNISSSDVDFRGIFCGDPINILTPFFPVREITDASEEDTKYYELAHFMKLCLDCNPNIIEQLWVSDEDIVFRTPAYDLLRNNRHALLSSKVAFTTSGYAISQLKRIKGHNKWLTNPQSDVPPKQKDFISILQYFGKDKQLHIDINNWNTNNVLISYGSNVFGVYAYPKHNLFNSIGHLNADFKGSRESLGDVELIVRFNKDEYLIATDKFKHYWEWKKNRNVIRSALEKKHGYDTKHAMHLVRLLRMGVEALRDEEIIVKRPDADELLAIRNGDWSYDEIIKYATSVDNEIRTHWYTKTKLRKRPDIKFAANLLMQVQQLMWSKH